MDDIEQAILALKNSFDYCTDNRNISGIKNEVSRAYNLLSRDISIEQTVSLHYSIATAFADIERIDINSLSSVEIEELQENYIYHYRAAIDNIENIESDTNGLFQQLYTNAANAYSRIGRILEAMRLFDKASSKYMMFPMALGNKGISAYELAHFTYDPNHAHILMHFAYYCLSEALRHKQYIDIHGSASTHFEKVKAEIERYYPEKYLDTALDLGSNDFGKTKREQKFRRWAIQDVLFLNELNDIMTVPIVATDYIHLPNMIYRFESQRWKFHYGMFNQIKQEYVSARYLFYKGIQDIRSVHIADKDVLQIEIDMDIYSHKDFCIRTAFRTLYSTLDKIAFFMNEYFALGLKVDKISFRSIWSEPHEKPGKLLELCKSNNMINSIYWLSKDIYEKNYMRVTKPSSKEFDLLRNRMEHRFVVSSLEEEPMSDDFTYRISTMDLYNKTLELMKLVREAIIYLSFALHIEESKKSDEAKAKGEYLTQLQTNVMADICK